ncbi:MAG: BrnT family toxin [Blastocatellia bacterium]
MDVTGLIWLRRIVEKLAQKHGVSQQEVGEVMANRPQIRWVEKGDRPGENLYSALGRTNSGRYLIVFFIYKKDRRALIISARDMSAAERKRYEKKR